MKKSIRLYIIALSIVLIIITLYSIFRPAPSTPLPIKEMNAYHAIADYNKRNTFASHRVNSKDRLRELKYSNIKNIEIDIFINHKNELIVGPDELNSSGLNLREYFDFINKEIPDFSFIWLDLKDLNPQNSKFIYDELKFLDDKYKIKGRVLIESRYPSALQLFSKNGWRTGYYLRYDLKNQPNEYYNEVINDINKYNISGVTFDCGHTELILSKFINTYVNNKRIELNCWDMTQIYLDEKYNKDFHDLDIILLNVITNSN